MGKKQKDNRGCPWKDDYLLNICREDEQHKGLFSTLNALHNALLNHDDLAHVDKFLTVLTRQTETHFHSEEEFMCTYDYPDYESHKRIHDLLLHQLEDLQSAQQSLGTKHFRQHWLERQEIADFLSQWLVDHIVSEDLKLGAFLRERGVK